MLDLVKIRYAVMSKANTSDFNYDDTDKQYEKYNFKYFGDNFHIAKNKETGVFILEVERGIIVVEFLTIDELLDWINKGLV